MGEAARATAKAIPKLRIGSWRCYKEYGFVQIDGQVTNISDASLDAVMAVGTFQTKSGTFVKSDHAMIDYQPIMAGQTSPFKVMTTDNPMIADCHVSFQFLFGGTISFDKTAGK